MGRTTASTIPFVDSIALVAAGDIQATVWKPFVSCVTQTSLLVCIFRTVGVVKNLL